ncbi:MAG: ROK family protein [Williamsia sp.]|nr:ROK family protein [Williamsia sp.]
MQNHFSHAVGVDIGGSHITAALIDLEHRVIVPGTLARQKLDPHGSAEEIIAVWSKAIREAQGGEPVKKVGIAMPGPFDYAVGISLIRNQNKYDALYGVNVKQLLAQALSISSGDIRLENDAACFLQGEAFAGAANGFDRSIGLTLGTGLGSARCRHGRAESLDLWNAPFKDTIAEDYISTRWFVNRYVQLTGKEVRGVKELVALAEHEPAVKQVFDEFIINLQHFLQTIIQDETPQVLVIGGNIAHAYALFEKAIQHTKEEHHHVHIRKAELGETAAILGAASLWEFV